MVWPSGEKRAAPTWPPRNVSLVKTGVEDFWVACPAQNAAAATNNKAGIAISNGDLNLVALARCDPVTGLAAPLSDDKLSRSKARSRADWKRCPGSFSRQCRT